MTNKNGSIMKSEARRFRKKPVEIEAVQWTGDNFRTVYNFTDWRFDTLHPDDRDDDPDATAQVFDELHSTWVLVYDGDWIIKGIKGEFYPCRDEVFQETYEAV